jgi:hypothetical protein
MVPAHIVKAGWCSSMAMPTGPKRSMVLTDLSVPGAVENRVGSL